MTEMNTRFIYRMLWMWLLAAGMVLGALAQPGGSPALTKMASGFGENLVVFTDRSIYTVNETLRFSALLQSSGASYQGLGSRILYAELVNAAGGSVARGKYPLENNRSAGSLSIPSSLPSGMYYLRSYTRWMRNFRPENFSYLPIRILNPYSDEKEVVPSSSGIHPLEAVPGQNGMVAISLDKAAYSAGDTVKVEFSLNSAGMAQFEFGCLTVAPSGAVDTSAFLFRVDPGISDYPPFEWRFFPELNGTSISGVVVDTNEGKPVSGVRVHMSILGEDPTYLVADSDGQGKFLFNTPYRTGFQEMFVVPEHPETTPVEVLIDNDFASDALPFLPGTLDLDFEEKQLASRLSLNMQLKETFLTDSVLNDSPSEYTASLPFYGTPQISILMDEFVSLPNMEEVIENLLPRTFVVRNGEEVGFLIKSDNPLISMFPPLILVDHIPVFDMEAILSIPPNKIRQIDVIPEVYVVGAIKYGGIISLSSQQGDLASIKLPEASYFFDFMSVQADMVSKRARYPGTGKIPDMRNTLHWNEHFELHKDSQNRISFQASSVPGGYVILFRGILPEGDMVFGIQHFRVE